MGDGDTGDLPSTKMETPSFEEGRVRGSDAAASGGMGAEVALSDEGADAVARRGRLFSLGNSVLFLFWAILFAGTGEYLLVTQKDGVKAAISFGIGSVMFLVVLLNERFPSLQSVVPSPLVVPKLTRRPLLLAATVVALVIPLCTSNLPFMYVPNVVIWLVGLLLAMMLALPSGQFVVSSLAARNARYWRWLQTTEGTVVTSILVVGVVFRLYDLTGIPSGVHGDEAELALISLSIFKGAGPHPFGTAFLGDPALFLYFEAPFLAIFGQTVVGFRALAAVSGALTLPVFYYFVRTLFGRRVSLLALILLTGSAVCIHFSRVAISTPQVPLLMCLGSYALWKGYVTRRGFWWLVSGICGAMSIYFNFAGRLFPVIMLFFFVSIFVFERRCWREWLKGAAFGLLGGLMVLAPMIVRLASDLNQFTGHMTDRLIFNNWDRMISVHGTSDVLIVLWEQSKANLLGFISGMNGASFYPYPGQPMLAVILGPVVVFALIYMIVRWRDPRMALLFFSFWVVIVVNGIVTIDAPQPHRILPALLPLLTAMAVALDWMANVVQRITFPRLAPACFGAVTLLVVGAGLIDIGYYFGPGVSLQPWDVTTRQATYVAALGSSYRVYTLGTPMIYFDHGVTRYLAPDVKGGSLNNPMVGLPLAVPSDRDLAFLVYQPMNGYLSYIQGLYPNSRIEEVKGANGILFNAMLVPRSDVARYQGLMAHYPNNERLESEPGKLGGGAKSYPAAVTWSGSLYVEKQERYSFFIEGVPVTLKVDGAAVGQDQTIDLAVGWHAFEMNGTLDRPDSRVSLRWKSSSSAMSSVPVHLLDGRSLAGKLVGRVQPSDGAMTQRRDRAIGFRGISDFTGVEKAAKFAWEGYLNVDKSGPRTFMLTSSGNAELTIDGKSVTANSAGDSGLRSASATIDLSAGVHSCAVRYEWKNYPGSVEVLWSKPGGTLEIIPPEAFVSAP